MSTKRSVLVTALPASREARLRAHCCPGDNRVKALTRKPERRRAAADVGRR